MKLNGDFEVNSDTAKVWASISGPDRFLDFLPGVESVDADGDRFDIRFKVDIKQYTGKFIGASYLSNANIKFSGRIKDKVPGSSLSIEGTGKSIGIRFRMKISIKISKAPAKTVIHWGADVDIGGFVKLFGQETVRAVAENSIKTIIDSLKRSLSE